MKLVKTKPAVTLNKLTEDDFQNCFAQGKIQMVLCMDRKEEETEGDKFLV